MLIKTQRTDKGGLVSQLIRWLPSFEIVITGKSVIAFNKEVGKSEPQGKGKRDSSAFEKISVEMHMFSVPQTDTGALVEYTKASGRQQLKELGNKN